MKLEAHDRRRRIDLGSILRSPPLRRELFSEVIMATQARAGIKCSRQQAQAAYDKAQAR